MSNYRIILRQSTDYKAWLISDEDYSEEHDGAYYPPWLDWAGTVCSESGKSAAAFVTLDDALAWARHMGLTVNCFRGLIQAQPES